MDQVDLPVWDPFLSGCFDVQSFVREYVNPAAK
jgi:hypothetical protein